MIAEMFTGLVAGQCDTEVSQAASNPRRLFYTSIVRYASAVGVADRRRTVGAEQRHRLSAVRRRCAGRHGDRRRQQTVLRRPVLIRSPLPRRREGTA